MSTLQALVIPTPLTAKNSLEVLVTRRLAAGLIRQLLVLLKNVLPVGAVRPASSVEPDAVLRGAVPELLGFTTSYRQIIVSVMFHTAFMIQVAAIYALSPAVFQPLSHVLHGTSAAIDANMK